MVKISSLKMTNFFFRHYLVCKLHNFKTICSTQWSKPVGWYLLAMSDRALYMVPVFFEAWRAEGLIPDSFHYLNFCSLTQSILQALIMFSFCNNGFSAIALLDQSFRPCWHQVPKLESIYPFRKSAICFKHELYIYIISPISNATLTNFLYVFHFMFFHNFQQKKQWNLSLEWYINKVRFYVLNQVVCSSKYWMSINS